MKKAALLFGTFFTLLFFSCVGPEGPPGPAGFDGLDGLNGQDGLDAPLPKVIDIEGTFTADNEYGIRYTFEDNVEVLPTDVVLAYLLWDQVDGSDGELIDIWRLLPQTRILDQGLLQYNYEHTFVDVDLFLEADFDLGTLQPGDTDNQIFRIAILPAEMAEGSRMDKSNVASVMQILGVEENDVPRLKVD